MKNKNKTIWSKRFKEKTSKSFERIGSSIKVDKRLYREDLFASTIHTKMLIKQKIIPSKEGKKNQMIFPKGNYYKCITMNYFLKKFHRKYIFKSIGFFDLSKADEIILVGSGKGVIKVTSIHSIKWFIVFVIFF